jgi:plasmid stability protein
MTDLLIRDIDPQLKGKLEQSAETHKQSLSDEAKALLRKALGVESGGRKLGTLMRELLPPESRSDDNVFEIRGEPSAPPDFE